MKTIKLILICAIAATSLSIPDTAQAQSIPIACQISDNNLIRYVSQYDIFNYSAPTPYRAFIQNRSAYKIDKNLTAKPLFYTILPDGSIISAFQLKGIMGKLSIGKNDVVTQHIRHGETGSYAEVIGHCINGNFIPMPKQLVVDIYKLPLDTQYSLQEARTRATYERSYNMFR